MMELVANKHRAYLTGFLFLMTLPVATFGGLIARSFAQFTSYSWRWNYVLNLITNSLAAVLFYFCYHPPRHDQLHEGRSIKQDLRDLDWVGIVLYSGGLTSFVLGLAWGGGLHPWTSYHVLVPLILGPFIIAAFVLYGNHRHLYWCMYAC
jgi:hypothetical protein